MVLEICHLEGCQFPMATNHQENVGAWSTPIHSDPHLLKFYRKCGPGWIRVDQEDQGDHNPPGWTRTGFYILLMMSIDTFIIWVTGPIGLGFPSAR